MNSRTVPKIKQARKKTKPQLKVVKIEFIQTPDVENRLYHIYRILLANGNGLDDSSTSPQYQSDISGVNKDQKTTKYNNAKEQNAD